MDLPDFLIVPEPSKTVVKDVTRDTQLIHNNKTIENDTPKNKIDIINVVNDYWQKRNLSNAYQTGILLGNGDSANIKLKEFLKKFKICLETIVRQELINKEKTSEEFKNDFKTLDSLFSMIISHLEKEEVVIENEKTLATLQGFINAYVASVNYG